MTAIEFENISKQYRLGLVSTRTLSHDINRWWQTSVLHKEDPYLKIGETNDRATKGSSEYVWALRDINFKVEQGDVVGIIGKNGAGKSTLLKLLSKVTGPTTGTIRARGRIGSLLEVGTGFHQEMTGRENIYLNGAILGMSRQEISRKLDEIVDFSGCERYIDTPVKRYSSGMMVRLGFAVAAHLDPEILVVDEVLAVGDAEFQKKAIGKMQNVSKGEGRTVLFVSHNMTSVKSLCKRGVLLENGIVDQIGDIDSIVTTYLRGDNALPNHKIWNVPEVVGAGFELLEIGVRPKYGKYDDIMHTTDDIEIVMRYRLTMPKYKFWITLHIKNEMGDRIFSAFGGGRCYEYHHAPGDYEQICTIPANMLNWETFTINLIAVAQIADGLFETGLPMADDLVSFSLSSKSVEMGDFMGREPGDFAPLLNFTESKLG